MQKHPTKVLIRQESSGDEGGFSTAPSSRRSSESDSGVGYLSEYEEIQQAARILGKLLRENWAKLFSFIQLAFVI